MMLFVQVHLADGSTRISGVVDPASSEVDFEANRQAPTEFLSG